MDTLPRIHTQETADSLDSTYSVEPSETSLLVAVLQLNIDQLHLKRGTYKALVKAGVSTIGEVMEAHKGSLKAVPRAYRVAIENTREPLETLLNSVGRNGEIDWVRFCQRRGLQLLPKDYGPNASPEQIVKDFPCIIKEILDQNGDGRRWMIIKRRYGLEGASELTLEDLGNAFNLTRQRVQQIEENIIGELQAVLIEQNYVGKNYRVRSDIVQVIQEIYQFITTGTLKVVLETDLLKLVQETFNIEPAEARPSVLLICSLTGIKRVDLRSSNLIPVWGHFDRTERDLLERTIKQLDDLLTRESPLPFPDLDVLIRINKNLDKSQKITLLQLQDIINLCSSVERREDGTVWGKFECLKVRANQVERLLIELGQPMSIAELAREINARLVPHGQRSVQLQNLSNQLSANERLVPVGRSGYWGLREWEHLETGSILTLMEQFLTTNNKPASAEEIFAYVKARRPVSRNSIDIYLSQNGDIFTKLDGKLWGLASWPGMQKLKSTDQQKRRQPVRKRATLQQKVGDAVKKILEKQPGKQMVLTELMEHLRKEFDSPKHTLYQYISRLDSIERDDLLGWPRTKLCRLKSQSERLQFPQVREIRTDSLRQKIERTLPFLNEDHVDIGLFLLSKEFEALLKNYLIAANSKGQMKFPPVKAPDVWKLNDMINYAKQNEIITDLSTLNYLRQERNNRAHGTMPSLEERHLLMKNVRSLAGLYIGYIKILDDLYNNLFVTIKSDG